MVPIRVHVLFHPESSLATGLAGRLFEELTGGSHGARIPVRYGQRALGGAPPDSIPPDADHALFVALFDKRMSRRARSSDRVSAERWAEMLEALALQHPATGPGPHAFLPVAADDDAFGVSAAFSEDSFVRLGHLEGVDRDRHLVTHVTARLLRLLEVEPAAATNDVVDELPATRVQVFLSHAKKDLPSPDDSMGAGPVGALVTALASGPVDGWFDAKNIPPGGKFGDEIKDGVLRSSALIAVMTDSWSDREWCRREVLEAKSAGRPIVVVDAVRDRVTRLFPYVGNAPTLRWRAALAGSDGLPVEVTPGDWNLVLSRWEREDAASIIQAVLLEALRYEHAVRRLRSRAEAGDYVLGTPPEALTISDFPAETRVWYPDPPLGLEELEELVGSGENGEHRRGIRPDLDLLTPITEFTRWPRPPDPPMVALSLSGAPDTALYGGSPEHLAVLADDLILYLLLAGMRVGYGGSLTHGGHRMAEPDGDAINYTERLFALARSYSPLAASTTKDGFAPIENWVAWPIHLGYGDAEFDLYGQVAVLEDRDRPPDLDMTDDELEPDENGFFPPTTVAKRFAWARALTQMRTDMTDACSARVVMGGKLTGFLGAWPGVLEEGVVALRAQRPVFVLGAFGGAARVLIDALEGREREELTTTWCEQELDGWSELVGVYASKGVPIETPETLRDELRSLGAAGPAAALANGLDDDENRQLFVTDDADLAVSLILAGLQHLHEQAHGSGETP